MAVNDSIVGQTIRDHRILEKLGEGGMGAVYKAWHIHLEEHRAVKILRDNLVANEQFLKRFKIEAKNASKIKHPNVVLIYDFGEAEAGLWYLAMEYIEGENLEKILNKNLTGLPTDKVVDIVRQISQALSAAHQKGIIHRDLKPANIMLADPDKTVEVKILDFGISKALGATAFTQTGSIMGTPAYMSPEQAKGKTADSRSDLYSLGMITYALLVGRLPFESETAQGYLYHQVVDAPPPLRKWKQDITEGVEQVVLKALEKKPEARYQSVESFIDDLTGAIDLQRNLTIPPPVPQKPLEEIRTAAETELTEISEAPPTTNEEPQPEQPKPEDETRKQPAGIKAKTELQKETTKAKSDRKYRRSPWLYMNKPLIGAMSIVLTVLGGYYFIFKPMFDVKPPAETTLASKKETTSDIKPATDRPAAKYQFRSSPRTLSAADVQRMLKTYDFYESGDSMRGWNNPKGKGIANDFQRKGEVVYDAATGLTWQQSGSSDYRKFTDASKYTEQLKKKKFAGYSDWRLPTLEEAMSLMEPKKNERGMYIDPIFDKKQSYIWTADTKIASLACGVRFSIGYCSNIHVDFNYFVRAVR